MVPTLRGIILYATGARQLPHNVKNMFILFWMYFLDLSYTPCFGSLAAVIATVCCEHLNDASEPA